MFYTPKPRQFRYKPRFYDPEKERWEALKQKYADEQAAKQTLPDSSTAGDPDSELENSTINPVLPATRSRTPAST